MHLTATMHAGGHPRLLEMTRIFVDLEKRPSPSKEGTGGPMLLGNVWREAQRTLPNEPILLVKHNYPLSLDSVRWYETHLASAQGFPLVG